MIQAQEITVGDGQARQEIDVGLTRPEGLQRRDDPRGELAGRILLRAAQVVGVLGSEGGERHVHRGDAFSVELLDHREARLPERPADAEGPGSDAEARETRRHHAPR